MTSIPRLLLGCLVVWLVAAPGLEARYRGKRHFAHCPGHRFCKALDEPPNGPVGGITTKIMNGFLSGDWKMYPYMVALISEANLGTGAAYCSGILIGNSWVLTVASCLTDGSAGGYYLPGRVLMQLRTTVPPADGDAQYASVPLTTSDLYWPATYRRGLDMNIGLMKLDKGVTGSMSIANLMALGGTSLLGENYALGIAGFGVSQWNFGNLRNTNPNANSNVLRLGMVALMKSGSSGTYIKAGNTPTRNAMCAGDWGAPILKWSNNPSAHQIVGLYISGPACNPGGTGSMDGYYTDLTNKAIRDFINKVFAINSMTPLP